MSFIDRLFGKVPGAREAKDGVAKANQVKGKVERVEGQVQRVQGHVPAAQGQGSGGAPPGALQPTAPEQPIPPQAAASGGVPMGATKMCPNGHVMDASWDQCPYCPPPSMARAPVPPTRVGPPPVGPSPSPAPASGSGKGKKTQVFAQEAAEAKRTPVCGWLVCLNGNHKGEDFRIRQGRNIIGSSPGSDIHLTDAHVSGTHAHINVKLQGDELQYVLIDMDSTNGTFLNDNEDCVSKEELVDGDTVTLGQTRCKFKCL